MMVKITTANQPFTWSLIICNILCFLKLSVVSS